MKDLRKMNKDEIANETSIETLRTALTTEERITYRIQIKKQINKLLIIKNGVIDYDVLKKLVDDIPFHNPLFDNKENVSPLMKSIILDRDRTCILCHGTSGNEYLDVHHVIPGTNANQDNLVLLCMSCHEIVHLLLKRKGYRYGIYRE